MEHTNQQKGSALIGIMIVICIIGFLYYYVGSNSNDEVNIDPVNTIKTYNKATDDLDDIRKQLDANNIEIENEIRGEVASTSIDK
jgi:hypothetical protein